MLTLNLKNIATTDLNLRITMQGYPFNTTGVIRFHHRLLPKGYIDIREDFGYDGASIPKLATVKLGSGKNVKHLKCSLPHDWLYRYAFIHNIKRKVVDIIYKECLIACGTSKTKANIEYITLRLVGWRNYK